MMRRISRLSVASGAWFLIALVRLSAIGTTRSTGLSPFRQNQ